MARSNNLTLSPVSSQLLDFNAIYDIGRLITRFREPKKNGEEPKVEGKYLVENGVIKSNGVSEEAIRALQDNLGKLIALAQASRFGLYTRFIELSLFDPADPKGKSFYTVLVGHPRVVKAYLNQMNINLASASDKDSRGRGALVPESALYEAPFYGATLTPAIACDEWTLETATIFFGAYSSPTRSGPPPAFESMNNFVQQFFNDVMNNTLRNVSGKALADIALLVPLARPAGVVLVDSSTRLRGGGLFIFGKVKSDRKRSASRLALYLLNALNRAIMAISYSSIEHLNALDKQRAAQYATEAHEVRKVIRFIDASYPPHVLEEVNYYFNTLFAATYDHDQLIGTEGILPAEFAKGADFKEFFVNAMWVASRIELMVKKAERHHFYETREALRKDAEEEVSRLDFCDRCEVERLADQEIGPRTRWALCSTLICVLRNVLKHSRALTSIYVDIDEDETFSRTIVIRNVSRNPHPGAKTGQSLAGDAPGKSYEAICYLVRQYDGDISKVSMNSEVFGEYDFLTTIPFPVHNTQGAQDEHLPD